MPAEHDNTVVNCCICLGESLDVCTLLSAKEENGKTWIYKLKDCVGEIDWFEDDIICQTCCEHVDNAYSFRQLCFISAKATHRNSDALVRSHVKREELFYDDCEQKQNFDISVDVILAKSLVPHDIGDVASYYCKTCSISFGTNIELEDHETNTHSKKERPELHNYEDVSNSSTYNNLNDSEFSGDEGSDAKDFSEDGKIKKTINSLARDFSCDICRINCKSLTELMKHSVTEHHLNKKEVKTYTCTKCTNKFRLASSLLQHLSYHDGLRDQICTFCGKGFMTRSDLISHEKIHSNELKYRCPDCDRTFKTHPNLRTHRMLKHTDRNTWPHECKVCGKRFLMKSGYNAHMRMHNNERPFSCHLCGKSFIENGVLLKHLRTHSNVRAFKCPHCDKEYKDKHNMKIHMVREHNIGNIKVPRYNTTKKFFCHLCPKGFVEKSKLSRHLNSHTGERPFACNICDKRFTDKSYIRPHMKTVHNSMPD